MTRRPWPRVSGVMIRLRRLLYWLGLRPKSNSIWYSPSMSFVYGMHNTNRAMYGLPPLEVGPLLKAASEYPLDSAELQARIRSEVDALYGPRESGPIAPPDGTRGPKGRWRGGMFWFDCTVEPILPDEETPRG